MVHRSSKDELSLQTILIAFRGTQYLQNVITEFEYALVDYPLTPGCMRAVKLSPAGPHVWQAPRSTMASMRRG